MLTRAEWDDAYANAAHIPNGEGYPPRWQASAAAFRASLADAGRARIDLPYGPSARQRLDLFLPEAAPRGLVIFVHGGYWLRFDKSFWSHLAAGPLGRGWAVAMPGYDLCPQVRIAEITRQVARAVATAAKAVAGPVALTGHSAGGHLAARMLAPGLLPDPVAGRLAVAAPISPVTDLAPLMKTSMNATLGIDPAEARAESPVNMAQRLPVPVTIHVGAQERPVFIEDAARLAKLWRCGLDVAPDRHHFDIIDALEDPASPLVRALTS